jgi:hypothetical protein
MATTTAYWLYNGVLVTPEGEVYSNVTINAIFLNNLTKNILVNANGEFTINYVNINDEIKLDDIQSPLVKLDIIPNKPEEYQPISLTNFVETPTSSSEYVQVEGDTKVYNLGTLTLLPPFQTQSKTLQDIELINITTPVKNVVGLPKPVQPTTTAKGSKRLRKFIFSLARRLPKYVLNLFAPFGITIATKVIEGVRGKDLESFKVSCPPREVLLTIIFLRNELTTILNNANKVITTSNNVISIVQTSLSTLSAILLVLRNTPIPTGFGLPISVINKFTNSINIISKRINQGQVGLATLQALSLILTGLLASILDLLNSLDGLIQKCAEEQNIPYNLINTELIAIQGNVENSYKGFIFNIKLENLENPQYPRRYAVAINEYGLIVLRSESSFTANPQTLIDQLKFIIDRDNLKAN